MHGAGWYADPGGKARVFRWWDGTGWTRWLSRDPSPPDPAPPAEPAVPGTADFPPPVGEPVEAPARPRMIAGGILAAVLLAVMAGGAVVSLTEDRMPTGPAVAPADAAPPPALIDYNPQTGRVSAEEMLYTVPGRPYRCDTAAAERQPTFRSVHSCFALVHENYDPTGRDWVSTSNFGVLNENLVTPDDLERTADDTFESILSSHHNIGTKITVRKRQEQPLDLGAPGRSRLISADLHYAIEGVPSSHDRIVLAVTQLESGRYAVWYATRPNYASTMVRDALDTSARTITARK